MSASGREILHRERSCVRSAVLKQGLQNSAGALVRLAVSVVTIPFLLRHLGLSDSGLWFWIQAVVALICSVESALATTATVFLSRETSGAGTSSRLTVALVSAVFLGVALAGALWLFATPVSLLAGDLSSRDSGHVVRAVGVSSLVVLARILQTPFTAMQHARRGFGLWNLLQTAQVVATSLGAVAMAMRTRDLVSLVGWQAVMAWLFLGTHAVVAARLWGLTGRRLVWSRTHWREMTRYTADACVGTLGAVLFAHGDRLVVGPLLGAAPLSVYAAMTTIASQINTLSATVAQPLLPRISGPASRDRDEVLELVAPPLRLSVAAALGLSLGVVAWGPIVMALFVPRWSEVGDDTALRLMALIYGLYSLSAAGYYLLQGMGRIRITGVVILSSGLASLATIWTGAYYFGLRGAVAGNVSYTGTMVLVALAMRDLGIPVRRWLPWLAEPLLIFVPGAACAVLSDGHLMLQAGTLLVSLTLLLRWTVAGGRAHAK